MSGVTLLTDAAMALHRAPGHPERPERLAAVVAGVQAGADRAGAAVRRPAVTAVDDTLLDAVHPRTHVVRLERVAASGGGWLDPDTYLGPHSMRAARLAAGATAEAALAVARGDASVAFAAVRPPGHHAGREATHGFCLLNNVAIAVAALRASGIRRIAVVDWDVHHGDGTQAIFEADPDLCYASTHEWGLFPGTGSREEIGVGPGRGSTHNRPLAPGSGDAELMAAWHDLLPQIRAFAPAAILVSCGFDAHLTDPLSRLQVTDDGYRVVALAVGQLAADLGLPGVALTLEGGYDTDALEASAAAVVEALLSGLAGEAGPDTDD